MVNKWQIQVPHPVGLCKCARVCHDVRTGFDPVGIVINLKPFPDLLRES
jgi:hypothetical protein